MLLVTPPTTLDPCPHCSRSGALMVKRSPILEVNRFSCPACGVELEFNYDNSAIARVLWIHWLVTLCLLPFLENRQAFDVMLAPFLIVIAMIMVRATNPRFERRKRRMQVSLSGLLLMTLDAGALLGAMLNQSLWPIVAASWVVTVLSWIRRPSQEVVASRS